MPARDHGTGLRIVTVFVVIAIAGFLIAHALGIWRDRREKRERGQAILSVARFRQPGGRGQKRPLQEKAAAVTVTPMRTKNFLCVCTQRRNCIEQL